MKAVVTRQLHHPVDGASLPRGYEFPNTIESDAYLAPVLADHECAQCVAVSDRTPATESAVKPPPAPAAIAPPPDVKTVPGAAAVTKE